MELGEVGDLVKKNTAGRAKELIRRVINRVEVDEMDGQVIAKRLIAGKVNSLTREVQTVARLESPFTIVPVLGTCGYQAFGSKSDYSKLYPEAYRRVRQILSGFVKEGALSEQFLEEQDQNNEITSYDYVDFGKLKSIAFSQPAQVKP